MIVKISLIFVFSLVFADFSFAAAIKTARGPIKTIAPKILKAAPGTYISRCRGRGLFRNSRSEHKQGTACDIGAKGANNRIKKACSAAKSYPGQTICHCAGYKRHRLRVIRNATGLHVHKGASRRGNYGNCGVIAKRPNFDKKAREQYRKNRKRRYQRYKRSRETVYQRRQTSRRYTSNKRRYRRSPSQTRRVNSMQWVRDAFTPQN